MGIRELPKPPEIEGDPDATEMIRVWIGNDDLCVSLLLGMAEDAEETDYDERDAWGELLSDVIKHISNGLHQTHGWDKAATVKKIQAVLSENLGRKDEATGGFYWEDEQGNEQAPEGNA